MRKIFSIIVIALILTGLAEVMDVSGVEELSLPSIGDRFVYQVSVTGDMEATKEEPNTHEEIYEFMGVKEVKGQTKDKVVENSKAYSCAWWKIERSDKESYTDQYLAMIENSLCLYLDSESNGDITYYITPLKLYEFPLKEGKNYSSSSKCYLWVHDTGSWIVSTYETGGDYPDYSDSATMNVTVTKENVTVPAGKFDCYKVQAVIMVKSGSGVTASTTTDTETFWYSPELKTFVKFESKLDVSAAFWQHFSGTRTRDLLRYEVKEVKA